MFWIVFTNSWILSRTSSATFRTSIPPMLADWPRARRRLRRHGRPPIGFLFNDLGKPPASRGVAFSILARGERRPSAAERPEASEPCARGAAASPDCWTTREAHSTPPEVVHQKNVRDWNCRRRRHWAREHICEHPRNRCSKCASGLAAYRLVVMCVRR